MEIEETIFQKTKIDFHKLNNIGFVKKQNRYYISKNILNDTLQIIVEIDELGIVKGKVIDLAFNDEYPFYRKGSQNGGFSQIVKAEFEKFLTYIKDNCTISYDFTSNQANRITKLIEDFYHDKPCFLWDDLPQSGVFRNPQNNKWYGLIMNINKNKLTNGSKMVDILNVKLPKDQIVLLLERPNFYPAYHMNKKNWLTIILDDSLSDEEIMTYLKISHQFTENIH